jgi:hypothetical protein
MDICEHMEVVDANGQHIGIVEKVEGERIKLIKSDASTLNIFSLTKAK